jgi:hypothetical protein
MPIEKTPSSPPAPALAVYDGHDFIGTVVESDGQFRAFDAHNRILGNFKSRRDAMRAIPIPVPTEGP